MVTYSPCIKSVGPANAKIVIIGEAPGRQEELTGIPFIGSAGQELDRMLEEAGISRSSCLLTNVLFTRPQSNKMENVCVKKKETPVGYSLPPVATGKYLHPNLLPEITRLRSELLAHPRSLIIALGNTAMWAVLGTSGISKLRGAVSPSPYGKVLPTYHPSAVLRDWALRPIVLADLAKAKREAEFPEIRRPERYAIINPTLAEVEEYVEATLRIAKLLSIDVETRGGSITCLGIARSKSETLVVPFFTWRRNLAASLGDPSPEALPPSGSYWNRTSEVAVRKLLNLLLVSPIPKLFQNGLYDLQYLLREEYTVCNCLHDTMLQQHALYPEMLKSLGFLGSVHTNEAAWKILRARGDEQLKREDD